MGLGQQDPAKHQLLAAFYTDSHQVGHIYCTASCPVRLEDLSALSASIFLFSLVVSLCLFTPSDCEHPPQPLLYVPIYQFLYQCVCLSLIFQGIEVNKSAERVCTSLCCWSFAPERAFDSLRWMGYIVVGLMMLFIYFGCERNL